jgi:hypothetical protein
MTGRSDTERFLDAFLAPEADQLSDRVLEAALADIARTPQRRALRVPWRFTNMPVFARAAAAALALVVLAAAGGVVYFGSPGTWIGGRAAPASPEPSPSPSPSASPRPSPPPLTERFTSTIHGISIDSPSGWQTRPATEPWTGGQLSFDSRAADVIFDPVRGGLLYLTLASQPYGPLSQDAWRSATMACLNGNSGGAAGSWRVDGARAFVHACGMGEGQVLVFTDTRGYFIQLVAPPTDLVEVYDWDWLKSVLETVDLRPEEALDANPSPSP